jgi:threonyl-tRNA synthetase
MNDDQLHAMRHSLAHITATAVKRLWPDAKFGVGPVVENGFYYDIDLGEVTISEADFGKIEKEMRRVINQDQPFEHSTKMIDEALEWAKDAKQPYKVELLNDLKRDGTTLASELDATTMGMELPAGIGGAAHDPVRSVVEVGFYTNGDFTDLCRGPHVESTGKVGAFKLMRVAGAYWRGNENNPQMQRLYGVAFATKEELDQHLEMLEQAKLRDHRKLGPELGIYMMSDSVGAGLPLMMPRGATLKNLLERYMRQEEEKRDYQYVETPVLAHENLYQRSGHASFYSDDMYKLKDDEDQTFYLKPMNCPHHHMIYEKLVESYRDLPLRIAEGGRIYRKELSGTLSGLIRVRGPITQNDSHNYVRPDQLKDEFIKVLELFKTVYDTMGVEDYWYRLSLPDFAKDKYGGDTAVWEQAGESIREAMREFGADFVEAEGEAAFYGPKIDVQTRNVMGKEDTIATSQVDVLVPGRMNLTYIDEESNKQNPIIIHRAILGSYERFIGFILEKTAGWLPFWLAPEQVRILTINDTVLDYVEEIESVLSGVVLMQPLKYNELRVSRDDRNESLGKKIREATAWKIPVQLIVGPKDKDAREVSVRTQNGEEKVALDALADYLKEL